MFPIAIDGAETGAEAAGEAAAAGEGVFALLDGVLLVGEAAVTLGVADDEEDDDELVETGVELADDIGAFFTFIGDCLFTVAFDAKKRALSDRKTILARASRERYVSWASRPASSQQWRQGKLV